MLADEKGLQLLEHVNDWSLHLYLTFILPTIINVSKIMIFIGVKSKVLEEKGVS